MPVDPDAEHSQWVLFVPTSDVNWRGHAEALTDAGLLYCLSVARERVAAGKGGVTLLKKLESLARKRRLLGRV